MMVLFGSREIGDMCKQHRMNEAVSKRYSNSDTDGFLLARRIISRESRRHESIDPMIYDAIQILTILIFCKHDSTFRFKAASACH